MLLNPFITPLDSSFFEQFLKCCYTDNFNLIFFDSLSDVVEYYRLLDYLQFVHIDKYKFVDHIHKMLDNLKPINNTHDKLFSEHYDAFRRYCGKYISKL